MKLDNNRNNNYNKGGIEMTMNRMQKILIKDSHRILLDTTNKSLNFTEEVLKKNNSSKEEYIEILEGFLKSLEYKIDEIRNYASKY